MQWYTFMFLTKCKIDSLSEHRVRTELFQSSVYTLQLETLCTYIWEAEKVHL